MTRHPLGQGVYVGADGRCLSVQVAAHFGHVDLAAQGRRITGTRTASIATTA